MARFRNISGETQWIDLSLTSEMQPAKVPADALVEIDDRKLLCPATGEARPIDPNKWAPVPGGAKKSTQKEA